jgi:cytochrome c5
VPTVRAVALLVAACASCHAQAQGYPEFADPRLKAGKAIWAGTCQVCHTEPASGAPQIADKAAWAPRIAKGKAALYRSALGGFTGPKGTEMPARGGNASLSEEQVRMAVDYMTASAAK